MNAVRRAPPKSPPAPLDREALYQKAVRLLARRSRSEAELRRLLGHSAAPGALEPALARLRELGYLDDRRFAASLALYARDVEKFGAERTRRELRRRGVAEPLAAPILAELYPAQNEPALLRAWLEKKRLRPPRDARETARLYRRLRLAGFASPAIFAALRRWRLEPEWLDALAEAEENMPDTTG